MAMVTRRRPSVSAGVGVGAGVDDVGLGPVALNRSRR